MTELIKIPFASSGDKSAVPDTDASGGVNWTQGYGPDYSKDPATDPSAKRIEREEFNGLLNKISSAIAEIQVNGVAPFITAADNGGSAFAYGQGAIVRFNNKVWLSLATSNTASPAEGASWTELKGASFFGTAATRNVGTAATNIPDMSSFVFVQSGTGIGNRKMTLKIPGGFILKVVNGQADSNGWFSQPFDTPFPNGVLFGWASERAPNSNTGQTSTVNISLEYTNATTGAAQMRAVTNGGGVSALSGAVSLFAIGY